MGLQKTSHDCATELNWSEILSSSAKSGMVLDWSLSTLGSGFLGWCCPGSWLAIMLLPPASGSSFSVRNNLCLQPSDFLSLLDHSRSESKSTCIYYHLCVSTSIILLRLCGFPMNLTDVQSLRSDTATHLFRRSSSLSWGPLEVPEISQTYCWLCNERDIFV